MLLEETCSFSPPPPSPQKDQRACSLLNHREGTTVAKPVVLAFLLSLCPAEESLKTTFRTLSHLPEEKSQLSSDFISPSASRQLKSQHFITWRWTDFLCALLHAEVSLVENTGHINGYINSDCSDLFYLLLLPEVSPLT